MPRAPRSSLRAVPLALCLLGLGGCLRHADRWIFRVLDPGAFDPAKTPTAPDYDSEAAWAALPQTEDGADVALPALPAASAPAAAVFYVHPTTWMGRAWNGPIDTDAVVEATDIGGTRIQASAFNACCAVWAPRYRQAHGRAFTAPDAPGDRARDVAYGDVLRAFEHFLTWVEGPFLVAAHSQGSALAARLVREGIVGCAAAQRLVAAYLVGGPVRDDLGLPVCAAPDSTGCFVAWNARTEDFEPNRMEFDGHLADPMAGRVCVNPLTWTPSGSAGPEDNAGAVFFDMDQPRVLPGFVGARCEDGALIITPPGDMERNLASRALLRIMGRGNFHPVEFQLFYTSIRANSLHRVQAFEATRAARPASGASPAPD